MLEIKKKMTSEEERGRGGNEIRSRRLQRKEGERDGSGFGCLAAGVGIGFGSPNESLTGAGLNEFPLIWRDGFFIRPRPGKIDSDCQSKDPNCKKHKTDFPRTFCVCLSVPFSWASNGFKPRFDRLSDPRSRAVSDNNFPIRNVHY